MSKQRMFLPAILVAGSVAAFSGCAVGPAYKHPKTPEPAAFANAPAPSGSNALNKTWWTTFNDPLLERLIVQASTNSYDIKLAEARLREARALWTEARFDFAPTARSGASFEKEQTSKVSSRSGGRWTHLYRAGFDATWELDIWGAVRRDVEAARATVDAVDASRDDMMITVQAEVAANYLELRGTQAELKVARQNATNQAQTLQLAITLLEGGQGTQFDVARARALLNETLSFIPQLEADAQSSMHRIAVLCGLQPTALAKELSEQINFPKIPTDLGLTNPTELLRRRPDVRLAERSLAAATARIGVETADLFPRVTFNGSIGLEGKTLSGLASSGAGVYSFGPRISWAAFDLGRVRERIKAADARAEQALDIYQQTVLLALEETENSLVALNRERERLRYLTEAERAATEAVQLARQRYRDGIADYLSVLDTERTLLSLQQQSVRAQTLSGTRLISVFKSFAASTNY